MNFFAKPDDGIFAKDDFPALGLSDEDSPLKPPEKQDKDTKRVDTRSEGTVPEPEDELKTDLKRQETKSDTSPLEVQKSKTDAKIKDNSNPEEGEPTLDAADLEFNKRIFSDVSDIRRQRQLIENVDDICRSSENDDFDRYLNERRFEPAVRNNYVQQDLAEEAKGHQERPRPNHLKMGFQQTATLFRPLNEIIESATLKITEDTEDNDPANGLYARLMQHANQNQGKS